MDKLKQWVALTVLAAVAILAAGWFLLVSPKKGEATDLREQAAAQVASNAQLQTQLQVLQAQAKDLPKKQADLARVAAKLPSNPALPALVRALTTASTSAGVEFVSITPGPPVAAVPAATAPVAAADPAAAPVAPADPAAAAPAAPAGATGTLASIPVAISVVGDYFQVAQFVANLENLPRALRITDLTLAPGESSTAGGGAASSADGRTLTTTITGSVFMAAGAAPATAVVAPTAAPAN